MFLLATIGCALAPSAPLLIVARGFQGLGGAALLPLPIAILVQMLPDPGDNEDAIKNFAMIAGLGAVAGPAIGGVLVHWFGWPAIFYLSVIMAAAVLFSLPATEESKRDPSLRLDGTGQVLSILSFLAISFALIEGNVKGWFSPIILGAFAVSIAGLAAFLYLEPRIAQPMIHLRYFGVRAFNVALPKVESQRVPFIRSDHIGLRLRFSKYWPQQSAPTRLLMSTPPITSSPA